MHTRIQGHHLNIGDTLRNHIEEKMSLINDKLFNRGIEANITLTKDNGKIFKSHITMKGGKDIIVQADSTAYDPYDAFETAAEKIAKQMRRMKRKMRDDHTHNSSVKTITHHLQKTSRAYLTTTELKEAEDRTFEKGMASAIIAEYPSELETLSVSDAVEIMEETRSTSLLFINRQNGHINMLHKRDDGHIGWIDTEK